MRVFSEPQRQWKEREKGSGKWGKMREMQHNTVIRGKNKEDQKDKRTDNWPCLKSFIGEVLFEKNKIRLDWKLDRKCDAYIMKRTLQRPQYTICCWIGIQMKEDHKMTNNEWDCMLINNLMYFYIDTYIFVWLYISFGVADDFLFPQTC